MEIEFDKYINDLPIDEDMSFVNNGDENIQFKNCNIENCTLNFAQDCVEFLDCNFAGDIIINNSGIDGTAMTRIVDFNNLGNSSLSSLTINAIDPKLLRCDITAEKHITIEGVVSDIIKSHVEAPEIKGHFDRELYIEESCLTGKTTFIPRNSNSKQTILDSVINKIPYGDISKIPSRNKKY